MNKLFLLLIIFLLIPISSAYYADIDIRVDDRGLVSIEGETNHPTLLIDNSPELTSKDGRYWLLNISPEGVFSNAIYHLELPEDTVINYMKLPQLGRIENHKGSITITGIAQDQNLNIIVQYEIAPLGVSWKWIYVVIGLLLIVFGLSLYFWNKNRKTIPMRLLTPRQRRIIKLLKKGVKTQAELEKRTGLPKSSLSRNIDSLVRKGYVVKEQRGMTNILRLK